MKKNVIIVLFSFVTIPHVLSHIFSVGDNSVIGLNAVVIKDVPEGSVVVPSPMMLISEHGKSL